MARGRRDRRSGLALGPRFLSLTGAAGAYADTPDVAALDITGDIEILLCLALDDWTPAAVRNLFSKWLTTGEQRSYSVNLETTGRLSLLWSTLGTAATIGTATSTVAPTVTDGSPLWIRYTLDVDNGAVGRDIAFYTSADPIGTPAASVTWTQLGTTVTQSVTTSIHSGSALPAIGASNAGAVGLWAGKVYYLEVRNGIGGTIVANPDFRSATPGVTAITDSTGKVWTVRGSAAIAA